MKKNYIGFCDDHSGSMQTISRAAIEDSNANILAVKNAATAEEQDTIVYRNEFNTTVKRTVVNSNPHVLKPVDYWQATGYTAFYDAIGDMIEQLKAVPDYNNQDVSFLVIATTDGDENMSRKYTPLKLKTLIEELQRTERWTFVVRVPMGSKEKIKGLGIPEGNIQEWATTKAGMEASTAATTQAMGNFMRSRSTGARSSTTFYAGVDKVDTKKLDPVDPKKISQYKVGTHPGDFDGMMIRDFILARRMRYLKGAAFYQLVKTEARVQPDKLILIQDRNTGSVYCGEQARTMIGLPTGSNARLHPGDHKDYNIFIQSFSINRKMPHGTGVIYWEEKGTEFTQEEIDLFTKPAEPKRVPKEPLAAQLPAVHNTSGRPVHSTMPVTQRKPIYYASRDDARRSGYAFKDNGKSAPTGKRWEQVGTKKK